MKTVLCGGFCCWCNLSIPRQWRQNSKFVVQKFGLEDFWGGKGSSHSEDFLRKILKGWLARAGNSLQDESQAETSKRKSSWAPESVCNRTTGEKNYDKKVFKWSDFNKPNGWYKENKCKFSHDERFWAGPHVGLCQLDGWSLIFLCRKFDGTNSALKITYQFLRN